MALPLIAGIAVAGMAVNAGVGIFQTISQNHQNEEAMKMMEEQQKEQMAMMKPFMQQMTQYQAQSGAALQSFTGQAGGLNGQVNQFTQQTA